MTKLDDMSISELRLWLVRRERDLDDPRTLLFPIQGQGLDPDWLEEARVILDDKVDRRDYRVKVASVIAGSLLGLGGLAVALTQFLAG